MPQKRRTISRNNLATGREDFSELKTAFWLNLQKAYELDVAERTPAFA